MSPKHRLKQQASVNQSPKPDLNPGIGKPISILNGNIPNQLYWAIPIILFLGQVMMTFNSMSFIRYEELAESARNPWWFQNQYVYDGVSSSVWWYATQVFIYKLFGYTLFTTKIFRLVLGLVSLFCLAILLRKFLGEKRAVLPLLAIGSSPTLLYFNTLMTSYGLDLQYLPILLLLLIGINPQRFLTSLFLSCFYWSLIMIAWLSYPVFVYYLPVLGILYLWRLISANPVDQKLQHSQTITLNITFSIISFLLPLVTMFLYFKNAPILYWDQVKQSGVFRGAGSFMFDMETLVKSLHGLINDLTMFGNSYYFEVAQADFSQIYPLIALIIILVLGIIPALKQQKYQKLIFLILMVLLSNLLISSFTNDPSNRPGIRRYTPIIAMIYSLYCIGWFYYLKERSLQNWQKWLLVVSFLIIPLHHILSYPINLNSLRIPSLYSETQWFKIAETPAKSLDMMLKVVTEDELKLGCKDPIGAMFIPCRYNEVYAAVEGYCKWNNLDCNIVSGYDLTTQQQIPLSIDLWETYQFEH